MIASWVTTRQNWIVSAKLIWKSFSNNHQAVPRNASNYAEISYAMLIGLRTAAYFDRQLELPRARMLFQRRDAQPGGIHKKGLIFSYNRQTTNHEIIRQTGNTRDSWGRAAYAFDERKLDMLEQCYNADASMLVNITGVGEVGPFEGREAILQLVADTLASQTDVRRHVISNFFFESEGKKAARVVFPTLLFLRWKMGKSTSLSAEFTGMTSSNQTGTGKFHTDTWTWISLFDRSM